MLHIKKKTLLSLLITVTKCHFGLYNFKRCTWRGCAFWNTQNTIKIPTGTRHSFDHLNASLNRSEKLRHQIKNSLIFFFQKLGHGDGHSYRTIWPVLLTYRQDCIKLGARNLIVSKLTNGSWQTDEQPVFSPLAIVFPLPMTAPTGGQS